MNVFPLHSFLFSRKFQMRCRIFSLGWALLDSQLSAFSDSQQNIKEAVKYSYNYRKNLH